jgi:hypothetical protein
MVLETPRAIIGTESKLPESTRGVTSFGNSDEVELMAAFRRSVASAAVVPKTNDTRITESPVEDVTVVESRPSRLIIEFSSGLETRSSTTSGLAPG